MVPVGAFTIRWTAEGVLPEFSTDCVMRVAAPEQAPTIVCTHAPAVWWRRSMAERVIQWWELRSPSGET